MNHNVNDPRHPWARLTTAARGVRTDRDASAPYGFATRVAALALGPEYRAGSLFDLFALRAVGIACLLALGSVALNYRAIMSSPASLPVLAVVSGDDDFLATTDAVAVVFDLAD